MQCPPEVAVIICEILRIGLLRIRSLNDAERCMLEADHLHNLPDLLANFRPDLLDFYWNVERVCFIEQSTSMDVADFESSWQALTKHVSAAKRRAIAS
jgi:hypothetical protein